MFVALAMALTGLACIVGTRVCDSHLTYPNFLSIKKWCQWLLRQTDALGLVYSYFIRAQGYIFPIWKGCRIIQ